MADYDYIIIGAGLAGASAAQGIRELDRQGSVLLIGGEPEPPYHRPPLSKGLWLGKKREEDIYVKTAPDWQAMDVALHLNDAAVELDPGGRTVTTAQGRRFGFGKLLLAMGGKPRHLPDAVREHVFTLRTLADYRKLRALAAQGGNVLIIGGSFIGAEMACALAQQPGVRVDALFPGPGPLAQMLPLPLSLLLAERFREHGIHLRPEDRAVRIEATDKGSRVLTERGQVLEADWILAGVGLEPNTALAGNAGLRVDDGVRVDAHLQSSHPGIYAAGDLANYPDPVWGDAVRIEHWDNAVATGRAAGRNMAGAETPFTHQSMFFSDLLDIGFEAVGRLSSRLETFVDMPADYRQGTVYYLQGGLVRGVLLWNNWDRVEAARALIAAKQRLGPSELRGRLR